MTPITKHIRAHVEKKLSESSIEKSPFPYLIISNFFPDDVYEKIMEYNLFKNNAGEEWRSKGSSAYVSSKTPYYARKQINFHNNVAIEGSEAQKQFWQNITDCFLGDTWFPDLVRKHYPEYFELRFGDITKDHDFSKLFTTELFLQRHEPGYYIGPHTDIATRVFTCIFAFAEKHGFEQFGTELLVPNDRLERCWGNDHYAPDKFKVVKVAPYAPNNFLLFFKTRHSFHSVKAIDETVPNQRYGMQFQFYEPSGGLFKDLSVPDIMHVKQKKPPLVERTLRKLKLVE
jgi:hypothetical protein